MEVDPKLNLSQLHAQGIENILRLLRSKGARQTCWVISEDSDLDGKELGLEDAVERCIGSDVGMILSCVPDRLTVFVGKDEKLDHRLLTNGDQEARIAKESKYAGKGDASAVNGVSRQSEPDHRYQRHCCEEH